MKGEPQNHKRGLGADPRGARAPGHTSRERWGPRGLGRRGVPLDGRVPAVVRVPACTRPPGGTVCSTGRAGPPACVQARGPGGRSQGPRRGQVTQGRPRGPCSAPRPRAGLWMPSRPGQCLSHSGGAGSPCRSLPSEDLLGAEAASPGGGAGSFLSGVAAPAASSRVPSRPPRSPLPGRLASSSPPPGRSRLLLQLPSHPAAPRASRCRPLPILLGLGDLSEPPTSSRKPFPLTPGPGTRRSDAGLHAVSSPRRACQLSPGEGLLVHLGPGTYQSCAD